MDIYEVGLEKVFPWCRPQGRRRLPSRITADFGIDPIVLGRGGGIAAAAVRAEWRSGRGGGSASEAGRGYHRRCLKLEKLLGA